MRRFLLALQASLARSDAEVSLVFDEYRYGSERSGQRGDYPPSPPLGEAYRQVFCVTHQPLLAAAADHHFRFSKVMHAAETTMSGDGPAGSQRSP